MVQFVDPRALPGTPIDPYDLSIDVSDGPQRIGLLANGFPDSVAFLVHVARALAQQLPNATFHQYNKGDASSTISGALLDTVVGECDAVVAAYGH